MGYSRNGMQRKKGYKRRQPMPSLHFSPANDQTGSDRRNDLALTLTRTTTHDYWDSTGTFVTASAGNFAFPHTYNSATDTWEPDGWGVELAAENTCLQSRDFDTSPWAESGGGSVGLAQTATGIDGVANTAWVFTDNSAAKSEGRQQAVTIANDGATHVTKFHVMKDSDTTRFPLVGVQYSGGTSLTQFSHVDTQNGTLVDEGSSSDGTATVIDRDLFWEVWMFMANNTTGNITATVFIHAARGTVQGTQANSATGSVTIDQVDFFENTITPAPSIITTAAAVTRNKDDMQTADITWFRADQGMFVIAWKARSTTNSQVIFAVHDNSASDRIMAESDATEGIRWFMTDGSSDQIDADVNATTADNVASKIAYGYKLNDSVAVDDGNAPVTDAACTIPTMTTFSVAQRYDETLQLGGSIAEIFYVRKRNSNSFAQTRSI